MEEQPIDNLFKRKLHDAEVKPSVAAWAALAAKRGRGRIVPVWTYVAVAASLLITGTFGWWALQSQEGSVTPNSIAVQVATMPLSTTHSPQNDTQIAEANRYTPSAINGQEQWAKAPNRKSFGHINLNQTTDESHAVSHRKTVLRTEVSTQQVEVVATKIETPRFDPKPISESIPEVAATKEIHKKVIDPTPERTLIVSIDVPAKVIPVPGATVITDDSTSHKTGFGSLLKKVKQIKEGDVLALSTNAPTKTNRRGLGKFYDDVKESIKNNSAD